MKILVTGGSGFIGSHAVRLLSARHQVLHPSHRELDLLDAGAVADYLRDQTPDAVIHAATWNATRTSDKDRSLVLGHNLRMYFNLAEAQGQVGRLIHYGSGAEFDRRSWREGMAESEVGASIPIDDYGLSKYLLEKGRRQDGSSCNLRLFGVYGPGEDWRIRFLSQACCRALFDRPILLRQDRLFDYTWVEDVIRVTEVLLLREHLPSTVNLSAGAPERLSRLAGRVLEAAGKALPLDVQEPGLGQAYTADTSRLQALLPDFQFTSLSEGIQRLYRHYQDHRDTIDPERCL